MGTKLRIVYRHCHKGNKKISTNQEKNFRKLGFEEIMSKSILYLLVNYVPHCVPPASGAPDFVIQKLQ